MKTRIGGWNNVGMAVALCGVKGQKFPNIFAPQSHSFALFWNARLPVHFDRKTFKDTSHSTIFDISMRPLREDQKHRHRFTR